MLDSGYWCSWLVVELSLSVLFALLLAGFGAAFGFGFFLKNSFGLVLALFVLFQWAMVGVAFLLGAFIGRATAAVTAGFVVFLVGWVVQSVVVFGYPFTPADVESTPAAAAIFALMPWALLAKGAVDLGAAGRAPAGETGISWARRSEYCQDLKGQPEAQVRGALHSFISEHLAISYFFRTRILRECVSLAISIETHTALLPPPPTHHPHRPSGRALRDRARRVLGEFGCALGSASRSRKHLRNQPTNQPTDQPTNQHSLITDHYPN